MTKSGKVCHSIAGVNDKAAKNGAAQPTLGAFPCKLFELAGPGAVCLLMGMRACLHLQDWEGAKSRLRKLPHCIDFKCNHLQVCAHKICCCARGGECGGWNAFLLLSARQVQARADAWDVFCSCWACNALCSYLTWNGLFAPVCQAGSSKRSWRCFPILVCILIFDGFKLNA